MSDLAEATGSSPQPALARRRPTGGGRLDPPRGVPDRPAGTGRRPHRRRLRRPGRRRPLTSRAYAVTSFVHGVQPGPGRPAPADRRDPGRPPDRFLTDQGPLRGCTYRRRPATMGRVLRLRRPDRPGAPPGVRRRPGRRPATARRRADRRRPPTGHMPPPSWPTPPGSQARVLVALGEPHSARGWAAFAYAAATRLYGRADERTITAAATLAAVLHRVGSDARAARLYSDVIIELHRPRRTRSRCGCWPPTPTWPPWSTPAASARWPGTGCAHAWELHREVYGDDHPSGIKMLAKLGAMERDCGRYADSHEHLTLAEELCRVHLAADDPLAAQVAALSRAAADPDHVCAAPSGCPPGARAASAAREAPVVPAARVPPAAEGPPEPPPYQPPEQPLHHRPDGRRRPRTRPFPRHGSRRRPAPTRSASRAPTTTGGRRRAPRRAVPGRGERAAPRRWSVPPTASRTASAGSPGPPSRNRRRHTCRCTCPGSPRPSHAPPAGYRSPLPAWSSCCSCRGGHRLERPEWTADATPHLPLVATTGAPASGAPTPTTATPRAAPPASPGTPPGAVRLTDRREQHRPALDVPAGRGRTGGHRRWPGRRGAAHLRAAARRHRQLHRLRPQPDHRLLLHRRAGLVHRHGGPGRAGLHPPRPTAQPASGSTSAGSRTITRSPASSAAWTRHPPTRRRRRAPRCRRDRRTSSRTMARPRPLPPASRARASSSRVNRSKTRSRSAAGNARPVVGHREQPLARPDPGRQHHPGRRVPHRVVHEVGQHPLQLVAVPHEHSGPSAAPPAPGGGVPVGHLAQQAAQLHRPAAPGTGPRPARRLVRRASSSRSSTSRASRSHLGQQVGGQLGQSAPPSRSATSSWVRMVASGLRSSCAASATNARCRARADSQPVQHVVEGHGQPAGSRRRPAAPAAARPGRCR